MKNLILLTIIANLIAPSLSFRMAPKGRVIQQKVNFISKGWLAMSDNNKNSDENKPKKSSKSSPVDLSAFSVGQVLEGKLVSVKAFGAFVEAPGGANVLLPRSVISKGGYAKLTKMVENKSKDLVKLEILSVNQQNQTLSGKYIPSGVTNLLNIADLESKGADAYTSMSFNATVVGVHDFGVFAELDEYGFEGLIPASMFPQGERPNSYDLGASVSVQIAELNLEKKRMTLSLKSSGNSKSSGSNLAGIPEGKWLQAVVTSVTSFGLLARPAGQDAIGLVHNSRIPIGLIKALKTISPPVASGNKTDIELLFTPGDIIRCRLNSYNAANKKIELAMTPKKVNEDQEDDYIVEGRDPEGEESTPVLNVEEEEEYDPQDTLIWWRGTPYKKVSVSGESEATGEKDEEGEIINESVDIIEGTWRRMFELDMREDAMDFESKIQEAELKELEEEIGELSGLDDELIDSLGFGAILNTKMFGNCVPFDDLPAEWKKELSFFADTQTIEKEKLSRLKGGKKAEQEEFEKLLREVEVELEAVSARRNNRGPKSDQLDPAAPLVDAAAVSSE